MSFVGRLTLSQLLHDHVARRGVFGGPDGRGDVTWQAVVEALKDKLQIHSFHLRVSLFGLQQGTTPAGDFAREFERRVYDAGLPDNTAKELLVAALNAATTRHLDTFVALQGGGADTAADSILGRLRRASYRQVLCYLQ